MASSERTTAVRGSPPIDRVAARYLFAVPTLSGDDEGRVTTGDLRKRLGVAPASVTEMCSKLDDCGLIDHEKYRGVTLTERGETVASRVGWRVCAVTTFFDSVLGTDLDDRTAFEIGVVLPREGVVRLRELGGAPCLDLCPAANGGAESCPV